MERFREAVPDGPSTIRNVLPDLSLHFPPPSAVVPATQVPPGAIRFRGSDKENAMNRALFTMLTAGTVALAGCTTAGSNETATSAAPAQAAVVPPTPGAIPGSVAADRDGDGRADGYYKDGVYYPFEAAPPAPAPVARRAGERG